MLPIPVNEENFPVSRVLKRIAKNLSFFSPFLFQVCHLPLKSNHILVDSEGGGKWAPSMRKSQRSQSLQILRTQARARRERGADPCVALGHLLPCSPLGACRTLSCSSRLHPRATSQAHSGSHLTSGKLCVSSLPHFATQLILVSVLVNHFL